MCPDCGSTEIVFTKHKMIVINGVRKILGIRPKYICLMCGCKWNMEKIER